MKFRSDAEVAAVLSRAEESKTHAVFVPEIKPEPILRKTLLSLKRSHYPAPQKLQQFYDTFMGDYEQTVRERAKKEDLAAATPDEDGFVTVRSGAKNSFRQDVPKNIQKVDASAKTSKKRASSGLVDYDGAHSGITATMLAAAGNGGMGGSLLQDSEQGRKMAALLGVEDQAAFLGGGRRKRKKENKGICADLYGFQQADKRKQELKREGKRLEKDEQLVEERMRKRLAGGE